MKEIVIKSVTGQLNNLNVGDKVSFPYKRSNYIKSACASYGRLWERVFSVDTTTNRDLIIVTRLK